MRAALLREIPGKLEIDEVEVGADLAAGAAQATPARSTPPPKIRQ